MSVQVGWDNRRQSVIRWEFRGEWNWEQLKTAIEDSKSLIVDVDYHVDILADFSRTNSFPQELPPDDLLMDQYFLDAVGDRLIVLVGCAPQVIDAISDWLAGRRDLRQIMAFMDSVEEARLILYEIDDEVVERESLSYQLEWLVDDTVLLIKFIDSFDIEDIYQLNEDMVNILQGIEEPFSIIMDVSVIDNVKVRPIPMRNGMAFLNNPFMSWMIIVGANELMKFLFSVVFQLTRITIFHKQDLDEAHDLLIELGVIS